MEAGRARGPPRWLGAYFVEDLRDFYWDLNWGLVRMARYFGVAPGTVRRVMIRAEIPTRPWPGARWKPRKPWTHKRGKDGTDPAQFWACADSGTRGVGCILCGVEVPEACGEDCAVCPGEISAMCQCAQQRVADT